LGNDSIRLLHRIIVFVHSAWETWD
jgi:hypothetical protein